MENLDAAAFYKLLLEDLGFEAKLKQDIALQKISAFVVEGSRDAVFLLPATQ